MHPILFELGPLSLRSYGLLVALAFYSGLQLARWAAHRRGISDVFILDLCLVLILSGLLGARLFYVALNATYFLSKPWDIFKVWEGGLVFYGGFLGAAAAGVFFARLRHQSVGIVADCIAPALALGQAVGRLGCFFAGCCYGRPTTHFWAIQFKDPAALAPLGIDLHPVQLYESALCLALAAGLWLLFKRYPKSNGRVFWIYVIAYGVLRFFLEGFRGDDRGRVLAGLQPSQWVALIAIVVGSGVLSTLHSSKKEGHLESSH